MFIHFFKKNQPASMLALPLFAALLWMMSWIQASTSAGFFSMPFFKALDAVNHFPIASELLAFILVITQSFYLNHILNKYDLRESRERSNFLAALFSIVFLSAFPVFRTFLPQHFSALFLLIMLDRIFDSYRKDVAFSNCFDAGFFVSIASLFYFPSLLFFSLVWISFVILRPFNWREWIIAFLGLLIPWVIVITCYFWLDRLSDLTTLFTNQWSLSTYFGYEISNSILLYCIIVMLLFIPAFMHFVKIMSTGKIKINKFFLILFWLLLCSIISVLIFADKSNSHFTILATPLAVVFSYWFLSIKKEWLAETLFMLLLIAFIYAEIV